MDFNFDDEYKIESFNMIASRFYERNFSTMSKSDFEVLIFAIYINGIEEKGL